MTATGRTGLPAVLLAGVLAAGALLWTLMQEDDTGSSLEDAPPVPAEATPALTDGTSQEGRETARLDPNSHVTQVGLPRVLPPDAAIEDVRDALALSQAERGDALERARDAMLRMASEDEKVVRALRAYADTVEDPVVRGVVNASLGTQRSDTHRRWLCEQVQSAPTNAERVGALIALAHPTDARRTKRKGVAGSAQAALLGGLAYRHDVIPPTPMATTAIAHWLRRNKTEEARAGLPIVLRCVKEYEAWAALLVGEDGRMRPWFSLLSSEDRARVKTAALAHAALATEVRTAISSAY